MEVPAREKEDQEETSPDFPVEFPHSPDRRKRAA
jgi:hypothetical protein